MDDNRSVGSRSVGQRSRLGESRWNNRRAKTYSIKTHCQCKRDKFYYRPSDNLNPNIPANVYIQDDDISARSGTRSRSSRASTRSSRGSTRSTRSNGPQRELALIADQTPEQALVRIQQLRTNKVFVGNVTRLNEMARKYGKRNVFTHLLNALTKLQAKARGKLARKAKSTVIKNIKKFQASYRRYKAQKAYKKRKDQPSSNTRAKKRRRNG